MLHNYEIYHRLMNGQPAKFWCMGRSMEPVYFNGEEIFIFPFTKKRPHPVVGDVVHFFSHHNFNRHQVSDIFSDRQGVTWYRLIHGDGSHDQFVSREQIIGYVIPKRMLDEGTEPNMEFQKT